MNILVTSDLHGNMDAFKTFSEMIKKKYDYGIIAGDLLEDSITLNEMQNALSLEPDDLLEELFDPYDTIEDLEDRVVEYKLNPDSLLSKTLQVKENDYRSVLNSALKTIFVLRGNHDRSKWESRENLFNINLKRFEIKSYNVVGFEYTRLFTTEKQEEELIRPLYELVDTKTILVTHAPAYNMLDRNYRGIPIGSKPIAKLVQRCCPAVHVFGHVHDSAGIHENFANVSFPKRKRFYKVVERRSKFKIKQVNLW